MGGGSSMFFLPFCFLFVCLGAGAREPTDRALRVGGQPTSEHPGRPLSIPSPWCETRHGPKKRTKRDERLRNRPPHPHPQPLSPALPRAPSPATASATATATAHRHRPPKRQSHPDWGSNPGLRLGLNLHWVAGGGAASKGLNDGGMGIRVMKKESTNRQS